jgi:L-ascorbate metabolism protein UlaG (beta-lactamase superfamily)
MRSTPTSLVAFLRVILCLCALVLGAACSTPVAARAGEHHTEGGFRNPGNYEDRSFLDFLRWRWQRMFKDIPDPGSSHFPLAENDPAFLRANREALTATWVGHATLLVQMGGLNVLTDPQFSDRASPVQWAGPRRVAPPGLALGDLPPIDVVLVSHDHYDSLDAGSMEALARRPGGEDTVFFVPLGFKEWMERRGARRVVELDWWETRQADGATVTAVPVQHWSKRSPLERNSRLWAGWAVEAGGRRFLFVGDTGYADVFKEIGERLGPFHLAAIPIGAYEPRWFMKRHHVSPEEAVRIHRDVRSVKSVGIHWGTFALTDEPLDEPPERLRDALRDAGIPEEEFVVLRHGETITIASPDSASALPPSTMN